MPQSYAKVCREANGEKLTEIKGAPMTTRKAMATSAASYKGARFDEVLACLRTKLQEIAPLAAAERNRVSAARKLKFDLMELPFNLRHTILKHAIDTTTIAVFLKRRNGRNGRYGRKPQSIPLPALTKAGDVKLRLEAILVTIENTALEIHSGVANDQLQEWLRTIDFSKLSGDTSYTSGFDAVKSLRFPYFSRFPHKTLAANVPNNDVELACRSQNLRVLDVTFVDEELISCFNNGDSFPAKSVDQMRREYRLDGLLGLQKLETLRLRVRLTNFVCEWAGEVGEDYIETLAAWFRAEFEVQKRRKKVKVVVI